MFAGYPRQILPPTRSRPCRFCDIQHKLCISAELWGIFQHTQNNCAFAKTKCKTKCVLQLSSAGCLQEMQDKGREVAQELRVPVPLHVSSQTHEASPVYASLVEAALDPAKHIPENPTLAVRRSLSCCNLYACCVSVVNKMKEEGCHQAMASQQRLIACANDGSRLHVSAFMLSENSWFQNACYRHACCHYARCRYACC